MIFSSQLGRQDGLTTEQSLKNLANHLRKMQEELEYRLAGNLDSTNIGEINADETKFLVKGEEIGNIIAKQDGKMSVFEQTVDGFRKQVADYEKGYSEWTQTVDGFRSTVNDYKTKVSQWEQTVDGFKSQVADYEKGYSEWTQTVDGFKSTVADYTKGYSTWEQTVAGFRQQVVDYQNALSTTLKMDATGVYITDQDGNTVTIQGDQIDVEKLFVDTIYLKYKRWVEYLGKYLYETGGTIDISGATSASYAIDLYAYGGLRMAAGTGDAYVGSYSGYVTLGGILGNTSQGDFFPSASDSYTLGKSYYQWADIYAVNGEITTSDREKKNSIDYDTEAYGKFFDQLKPCSYKLNDGTSDRKHVGMISQDVEEALAAAGLTTKDFAGFIKSPKKDKDGNVIDGEYDYGLRNGEFIGLCIAEIQKLKGRVDELERKENNDGQAG